MRPLTDLTKLTDYELYRTLQEEVAELVAAYDHEWDFRELSELLDELGERAVKGQCQ